MKGMLYRACVRSVLTYGAEIWAIKSESVAKLRSTERRMIRMMCGVSLRDMIKSEELASRVDVGSMEEHLRVKRLSWYGHVMRRESDVTSALVGDRGRCRAALHGPDKNTSVYKLLLLLLKQSDEEHEENNIWLIVLNYHVAITTVI